MSGSTVIPNTQAPSRPGDNLQAPFPQRLRTSAGDQEFLGRYFESIRDVAVFFEKMAPLDYLVAVNDATMDWPASSDMYEVMNVILVCSMRFSWAGMSQT